MDQMDVTETWEKKQAIKQKLSSEKSPERVSCKSFCLHFHIATG